MGALVAKSKLANTGLYKADADERRPGAWIVVNKKIYKKRGWPCERSTMGSQWFGPKDNYTDKERRVREVRGGNNAKDKRNMSEKGEETLQLQLAMPSNSMQ